MKKIDFTYACNCAIIDKRIGGKDEYNITCSLYIYNQLFYYVYYTYITFRNKRLWQSIIISLFCLGEISGYVLIMLELYEVELLFILELIGSIFGVLIGYVASMMLVLDGVRLFKSRRLKEFERNLNQ